MEAQRVVLIQDASKEVSPGAIRWALHGLSLKPGDVFILVGILQQVNNPMGYKSRVDSHPIIGTNQRIVALEKARKREEYENNVELVQIAKMYEIQKVEFKIEVASGPSPSAIALEMAGNLKATWVILDRQMKKDRMYFLENLSCGISRIKRDNKIKQLRGPRAMKSNKFIGDERRNSKFTYDEMVPGLPEEKDLFSVELLPTGQTEDGQASEVQELTQSNSTNDTMKQIKSKQMLKESTCVICNNRQPNTGWRTDFTYAEIQAATDWFSRKNSPSIGLGFSFRGQLKCGQEIFVKQYQVLNSIEEEKFDSEVHKFSKARHKNITKLLAACKEGNDRLLAYEYVCNGSLDQHLSKPLAWMERTTVLLGASRGLNYLHESNIVHKNIRTSNILLKHDFEPLLGDFGLPSTQLHHISEGTTARISQYLAPEYGEKRKFSTQTDVYAFGVVVLEVITGIKTTDMIQGEKSLVEWATPLLKERRYLELIDPRIAKSHDVYQLFWMARVTQKCLSKNPKKRLTMDKVVSALEEIIERKSSHVLEELFPTKWYSGRGISNWNGLRGFGKATEDVSFTSHSRSSSTSSTSSTTNKISLRRSKSESRGRVLYAEMLN
ncbi:receptor-like protein kinase [Tripterygium wilfordii]|uniref:Receptor-like protein kinase n=1 Tax=Tripterygium wilfordii TaxID=458696 RepID=A0A7J7DG18_TRIWF|nr:PTI1-like tyrosine-protein kinase At3g15890 [Tripterygium wilfordii]KAF5744996.1 receptor-like protein kinase [Tripterygium wilfordii]